MSPMGYTQLEERGKLRRALDACDTLEALGLAPDALDPIRAWAHAEFGQ
jgi:hypothetical protein